MSANFNPTDSSSNAVVSSEPPSDSNIALSNGVKVAVADHLLESKIGTLTMEGGTDSTVVPDSITDAKVYGDESEIVVEENVAKVLDQKEVNDEEKEGEYKVSDLVWAKVRCFPWWPGQIFDPSASTDTARKHSNKKGILIAYFGDRTLAWNERSKIKPFRKNFCKLEKQNNSNSFIHAVDCALDEALRRIEFGLSCSCLPKQVYDKIKSQVFVNSGIKEEASMIKGGDNFSTVSTFKPANVVQSVQDLAREHFDGYNRLQILSVRTQLLAYYRWKGYPLFSSRQILEDNCKPPLMVEVAKSEKTSSKKRKLKDDKPKLPSMVKNKKMGDKLPSKKRKPNGIAKQLSVSPLNLKSNSIDEQESSETKSMVSDSSMKSIKNNSPAALILKFTNLDSVPSVKRLNEIFRQYGGLNESETEVLKKSNCGKVVFEGRSNAETAFSSAGKFSVFGPALISYRLDYSPTPRKVYTSGKKKNRNLKNQAA